MRTVTGFIAVAMLVSLAALVVSLLLVGQSPAQETDAQKEEQVREIRSVDEDLNISKSSAGRVAGSYAHAGSSVSFSGENIGASVAQSRDQSSKDSPRLLKAQVNVNGLRTVWTYNPETKFDRFDPPEEPFTRDDIRALNEAGTALWRSLLATGVSKEDFPPEQKILSITFAYLSGTPAGYKLSEGSEKIEPVDVPPEESTVTEVASTQAATVQTTTLQTTANPPVSDASLAQQGADLMACRVSALASANSAAAARACARADNSFLRLTCERKQRPERHDANKARGAKRHCFRKTSVFSGPSCRADCPGQCGAGCNGVGTFGGYYQDCLDHDICFRHHNSRRVCYDERQDARGDFMASTMGGCGRCR